MNGMESALRSNLPADGAGAGPDQSMAARYWAVERSDSLATKVRP
jgi:hypothetical protein